VLVLIGLTIGAAAVVSAVATGAWNFIGTPA
jgi:hypothetical protein